MHQLAGRFVTSAGPGPNDAELLDKVADRQAKNLKAAAVAVAANPADANRVAVLLVCLVSWPAWDWVDGTGRFQAAELHEIGISLYEIGRFAEARPWCKPAARA